MLISNDGMEAIYESYCISQFNENDLKNILNRPFVVIPSNNDMELIRYLGGLIRFSNNSALLTDGSDLILRQGTVLTSIALPASMFLVAESLAYVETTLPPEQPYGVPITLVSNAEYVFEEGGGGAMISILSMYRRIVKLQS
jgi:hypothetical protein